jgi:hypothetical protein
MEGSYQYRAGCDKTSWYPSIEQRWTTILDVCRVVEKQNSSTGAFSPAVVVVQVNHDGYFGLGN